MYLRIFLAEMQFWIWSLKYIRISLNKPLMCSCGFFWCTGLGILSGSYDYDAISHSSWSNNNSRYKPKSKHIPMEIFRLACGPPNTIQTHNRHLWLAGFLTCWYDTMHSGRADRLRCGTVRDFFRREVKQKKWGTGVQWDTVASYPVDFTHSSCRHTSVSSNGRRQLVSLYYFSSVHFTVSTENNTQSI